MKTLLILACFILQGCEAVPITTQQVKYVSESCERKSKQLYLYNDYYTSKAYCT